MTHRDLGERLRKLGDNVDDVLQRPNEVVAQSDSLPSYHSLADVTSEAASVRKRIVTLE